MIPREIEMIVVVEGPSAAGKTTWAETHAHGILVPEATRAITPTEGGEAARSWAMSGAERWSDACRIEREAGIAVCDTDPLKLHYAWCLWQIHATDMNPFLRQASAYREQMAGGRIGFADVVLLEIPDRATLDQRKEADSTRTRRNFDRHVRMAGPLRAWYALLDKIRPGSVHWGLPDNVDRIVSEVAVVDRYDLRSFDALVAEAQATPPLI